MCFRCPTAERNEGDTFMQISYVKDRPELALQLIPGLLQHWSYIFPGDTAEMREGRFRAHQNDDVLPIAWIAHDGDTALGTAALRVTDLDGREDLGPWLGGVYTEPGFRRRGIAAALCRTVEAKAATMGIPRLYLFTHGQEPLYARMGWNHLEPTTWHGHACSIMWKVPGST